MVLKFLNSDGIKGLVVRKVALSYGTVALLMKATIEGVVSEKTIIDLLSPWAKGVRSDVEGPGVMQGVLLVSEFLECRSPLRDATTGSGNKELEIFDRVCSDWLDRYERIWKPEIFILEK